MALTTRELAYRRNGGIEVALDWDQMSGKVTLFVGDLATGVAFEFPVAPDRALDAFHHPYAYASSMGIDHGVPAAPALYA
jgi:hypothetical protein